MKQLTIILSSFCLALLFNVCVPKPLLKQYDPDGTGSAANSDSWETTRKAYSEPKKSSKKKNKENKVVLKKDKQYLAPIYSALQRQEYNNVLEQIESLDYTYPNNEDLFYIQGIAYIRKGHYSKALDCFNKTILINNQRGDALYYKSLVLFWLQRPGTALTAINQSFDIEGTLSQLVYLDNIIHKNINNTETGCEAEMYNLRANIFRVLLDNDAALADINKAILLNSSNHHYYRLKGEIYFDKQEFNTAYKSLQKATAIKADDWISWNTMGMIDLYSGKYYQAIKHFKIADELNPKSSTSITSLGLAYWLAEEKDLAFESMGAAIAKEPNAHLYFHLAYFHQTMNNNEQARNFFKKAQQLEPNILDIRLKLSNRPPQDSHLYEFYQKQMNVAKKYLL